uniref:Uncharacterized protein n=1 Tax=Kalanchoe fedtschenkoi TaxID=63787 RepID=A0A7N0SZ96_KALFE
MKLSQRRIRRRVPVELGLVAGISWRQFGKRRVEFLEGLLAQPCIMSNNTLRSTAALRAICTLLYPTGFRLDVKTPSSCRGFVLLLLSWSCSQHCFSQSPVLFYVQQAFGFLWFAIMLRVLFSMEMVFCGRVSECLHNPRRACARSDSWEAYTDAMRVSLITSLIRNNQMAFISNFVIHLIPAARSQHVVCNCVCLHNLLTRLSPNVGV